MSDTVAITNTPDRTVGAWTDDAKPNWIIIKERTARPKAGPTSKRREWDTDGIADRGKVSRH